VTIEIFYGVILFVLSVAVFALAMSIRKVDMKIDKVDSIMTKGLANMAQTVSDVVDTTTSLSDKLEMFDIDPIDLKIEQAKNEVLSEWIESVVAYNPYKGTPHRGN